MRNSKLVSLKAKINSTYGKGTFVNANTVLDIKRLSTGSIAFDRALGGGVPYGRITIFAGAESSGKTSNALRVAGLSQLLCANCYRVVNDISYSGEGEDAIAIGKCNCYNEGLFIPVQYPDENKDTYKARLESYKDNSYDEFRVVFLDVEGTYDSVWAQKIGVNNDRLLYIRPETAEQAINIYCELLETGEIDLFILDSLAAMIPSDELAKNAEDWQQGLQARLLGKLSRNIVSAATSVGKGFHRFPTHIWINQVRQKIGVLFGDNTVLPGGLSQLFVSSIIVKMWSSKWQKDTRDKDLIAEFQSEYSTMVRQNFKCDKNKTAPAKQTGSFDLCISGENAGKIDESKYFMAMAEKLGMVKEDGVGNKKKWYVGDQEFSSKKEWLEKIYEPNVYATMRNLILKKLLEQ